MPCFKEKIKNKNKNKNGYYKRINLKRNWRKVKKGKRGGKPKERN